MSHRDARDVSKTQVFLCLLKPWQEEDSDAGEPLWLGVKRL